MFWGKGKDEGTVFEGEFKAGKPVNGPGTVTYKQGDVFKGDTKKGHPDGKGKIEYKNGNKYEGDFKAGLRAGFGTETLKNGDKYEGQWGKDLRNGKGQLTKGGKKTWNVWKAGQPGKEIKKEDFDKVWAKKK